MTHAELVAAACRWLRGSRGCRPVFAEFVSAASETPDAIGWRDHDCLVVECKTSRSDMRADGKKPHRVLGRGAGSYRWILSPAGVLRPEDVPGDHGWAERVGRRVLVRRDAPRRAPPTRDAVTETLILRSAVRRHEGGAEWRPGEYRFAPLELGPAAAHPRPSPSSAGTRPTTRPT